MIHSYLRLRWLRSATTFVLAFVFLCSCSTINKSHKNSGIDIQIDSKMDAQIDVDMSQKLVGYAYGGYLFNVLKVSGDNRYINNVHFNNKEPHFFNFLSRVETVKAAAAYNAVRQSKADVLISPQFVVEETHWNPFWKSIKVKVTGFAGKVVGIKNKR